MLRGERVILRPAEREDIKRMHELYQNVELVMPGWGQWNPLSVAAMEKHFNKDLEKDEDLTFFAIEADGKLIGDVGLHHVDHKQRTAHLGIGISDPDYVGKGYGRDAVSVLLEWAFIIQGYRRISLTALATNERAIRAYRAVGFVEEGRLREEDFYEGKFTDVVVMGILRREWDHLRKPKQSAE